MRVHWFFFVALFALAGCSSASDEEGQKKELLSEAARFKATFTPEPSDPIVGVNRLEISLRTADDAPVAGAHFAVEGEMMAHGDRKSTRLNSSQ